MSMVFLMLMYIRSVRGREVDVKKKGFEIFRIPFFSGKPTNASHVGVFI